MTIPDPTVRHLELDDMTMHAVVRGEGEPLLLLHGMTGSSADWGHLFDLDALAREHTAIMPDLRGHGRSTNRASTFTQRQCAKDVIALLDSLGVETVRAVGTSLGGNTLLHLATLQPDRVRAMVVVSATPYYPAQARAIMRATSITGEERSAEEWASLRSRHHHGDAQIRALFAAVRAFADDVDDLAFTPPRLAAIRARTLIVSGDRDPLYAVELSLEMARAIPRAALWVVPNGGHVPIYGDARAAFAEAALRFLREA